jgi:general transcription factor IIIA
VVANTLTDDTPSEYQSESDDDGNQPANDSAVFNSPGQNEVADAPAAPSSSAPKRPSRKKKPRAKNFLCSWEGCGKAFSRSKMLSDHLRSHTGERPFACTYEDCDKAYHIEKHLKNHITSVHSDERSFVCPVSTCGKCFALKYRLDRHMKSHTNDAFYFCTLYPPCNRMFYKQSTLDRHVASDHIGLAPHPCDHIDPITFEACNAAYDGATALNAHKTRVHGPPAFFCILCTTGESHNDGTPIHVGFTTNSALQSHLKKEHPICTFCALKFASQSSLKSHIASQHSGTTLEERKNIACPEAGCDKRFTKASNLDIHVRTDHWGERFICGTFDVSDQVEFQDFFNEDGCGRDFTSKASLLDHVRIAHLGLPSKTNASHSDRTSVIDMGMDGWKDGKHTEPVPKSKKSRKSKVSAIDELIGSSYDADPYRRILCPFTSCPKKFIRDYDLQVHLRTPHPPLTLDTIPELAASNGMSPFEQSDIYENVDREEMNRIHGLADNSWRQQQESGVDDGNFWFGADEETRESQYPDLWAHDDLEMRALIDHD